MKRNINKALIDWIHDDELKMQLIQNSVTKSDFDLFVKNQLSPIIIKRGFKGSTIHFKKRVNEVIYNVIGINRFNQSTSQFRIELGVQYSFLDNYQGKPTDFKKLKFYDCTFNKTLRKSEDINIDWNVERDYLQNNNTIKEIEISLENESSKFFSIFNNFPYIYESMTVSDIENESHEILNYFSSSKILRALILLQINDYIGNKSKAKEISDFCTRISKPDERPDKLLLLIDKYSI